MPVDINIKELLNKFIKPPKKFSPVPIWWWSADKVTIKRLKWQMDKLVEGGIYNAVIVGLAPKGPILGSDADNPEYFSTEWWKLIEDACEYAYKLGMYIWFYDQIGFSSADHQVNIVKSEPSFAGKMLDTVFVEGCGDLEVTCPQEAEVLAVFAIPIDDNGNMSGTPNHLETQEKKVVYNCKAPHRLRMVYSINLSIWKKKPTVHPG